MTLGVPKVKPVMLFCESRDTVTGISVTTPAAEPPLAIIRREVNDTRTAAGQT